MSSKIGVPMRDQRFFSLKIATKVGRISRGQAASWAKSGYFVPSILYSTDRRPYTYLYSFSDLVALRVIWILRDQYRMSLANAKIAADHIRSTPDIPWSAMRIWIEDRHVVLAEPDGEDVAVIKLDTIAAMVKEDADKLWYRNPDDYGKIERRRGVMHGMPVIKGTRIPVYIVVNMNAQGASDEEILRAYPTLRPEDIRGVLEQTTEQRRVA